MKRTSLCFTTRNGVELTEGTAPDVEEGQVLIQSVVSAISAGTELLFLRGEVPPAMAVDESIEQLAGAPVRYPLKYGYSMVGRVAAVGAGVDSALEGRMVFAFHPHESCFVTTPDALVKLPADMSPEKAALLPTMETALSLVMDAHPVVGERVVVVGLGMVGLLVTNVLASFSLGRLVGVDPFPRRGKEAVRLGADAVVDGGAERVVEALRSELSKSPGGTEIAGADLVLELSGHPSGFDVAIETVGFGGRVLVGSWYGTKPMSVKSLGGSFHRKHVQVLSSQVSRLSPRWTGRWTKRRRHQTALALLERLEHGPLISHRFPLESAADAYAMLENNPQDALQVLLEYEEP